MPHMEPFFCKFFLTLLNHFASSDVISNGPVRFSPASEQTSRGTVYNIALAVSLTECGRMMKS